MEKNYYQIEPTYETGRLVGYWLLQCGTYGRSSVLAGEEYRRKMSFHDTVEGAQAYCYHHFGVYADVLDGASLPAWFAGPSMSDVAPGWFDEADAGEVWHEDDY